MTYAEFEAEGVRRFGPDKNKWRFVCPSCGHVASVQDWVDRGGTPREIAFSCVGRLMSDATDVFNKPGPCNYAGGGLFRMNTLEVEGEKYFAFADP